MDDSAEFAAALTCVGGVGLEGALLRVRHRLARQPERECGQRRGFERSEAGDGGGGRPTAGEGDWEQSDEGPGGLHGGVGRPWVRTRGVGNGSATKRWLRFKVHGSGLGKQPE